MILPAPLAPSPAWNTESYNPVRETGFINAELFKRYLTAPYADHEYFICGPNIMMDAIEKALGELGVPMSKYHSERYSFV